MLKTWDVATGREGDNYRGHTDRIWRLAYSADGKLLASGSEDGSVRLWEPGEPQDRQSLTGMRLRNDGHGYSIAFTPDSKTIATSGFSVALWDAATRRKLATLDAPVDGDMLVAYSPDGKTLASAGASGVVTLWDAATGRIRITLAKHAFKVWSMSFAPDGKTLATGWEDGVARLWEVATGNALLTIDAKLQPVRYLAYSPDGRTLAMTGGIQGKASDSLKLWDVDSGRFRAILETPKMNTDWVAFSPDGKIIAAGGWVNVTLWDAATGRHASGPYRTLGRRLSGRLLSR